MSQIQSAEGVRGLVNGMFVGLDQAIMTLAAAALVAAAGFVGAAVSRAVPAELAPANDNVRPTRRRRAPRRLARFPIKWTPVHPKKPL